MNSAMRCSFRIGLRTPEGQIFGNLRRIGVSSGRGYSTNLSYSQSFGRIVHRHAKIQRVDPVYITIRGFHHSPAVFQEQQTVTASQESRRLKLEESLARANSSLAAEKFDEAEVAYNVALQLMDLVDSPPEDRVQPYAGIAFALHCQGKHNDAAKYYNSSLQILKENGKDKGIEYGVTLLNYAELLSISDEIEAAEKTCREALELLEDSSVEHYAGALSNLATYLSVQNKFEEALEYSQKAVELFDKTLGHGNEFTLSSVRGNIRILQDLGRQEEADALMAKYEEFKKQITIDTTSKVDNDLLARFKEKLEQSQEKKSVDPEGFLSDMEMKESLFKEFTTRAQSSGLAGAEQLEELKSKLFQATVSTGASKKGQESASEQNADEDEEMEQFANQGKSVQDALKRVYSMKLEELKKEISEFHANTADEFKRYAAEQGIVREESDINIQDSTQLDLLEREIEEAAVEEDDDGEQMTDEEFNKLKKSLLNKYATVEDIYKVAKGSGSDDFLVKDLEDLENSVEDD